MQVLPYFLLEHALIVSAAKSFSFSPVLLIGIAGAGQILFRQPLPLLISSFIVGVGLAFLLVITAPFLTLNSTPEERPHLFSMNISLSLITLVLGEVIGGSITHLVSINPLANGSIAFVGLLTACNPA